MSYRAVNATGTQAFIHLASLLDQFQDDGFGNPRWVNNQAGQAAMVFINEDLH